MSWILLQLAWLLSPARVFVIVVLVFLVHWHPRPAATVAEADFPRFAVRPAASKPPRMSDDPLPLLVRSPPVLAAVETDVPRPAVLPAASKPPPRMSDPLPPLRWSPPVSAAAAARMLTQATFGPTLADIERLSQLGYEAWLDEQFAMPPSYQLPYLDTFGPANVFRQERMEAWFQNSLGGPDAFLPGVVHRDQLRQRVAFALSELLVISDRPDPIAHASYGVGGYYDVLTRNAFGNYRQLLEEVTLHPIMGIYLSMLGNQKPDPTRNIRPDENFAREILQLFSVGQVQLKLDGTPRLDAEGKQIPTYSQATVKGFAHVFTGWTFSTCTSNFEYCYPDDVSDPGWWEPMQPHADYHASAGSKQLLNYPGVALPGGVLPAGGTPRADLEAALDNIFNHPNLGPFVARHLIQRLVTSNPSPAYVARVATVFNHDPSTGRRGELKAVVRAVLLDPEARNVAEQPPHFGKVREPLLRLTHLWRALDARSESGRLAEWYPTTSFDQGALQSPSVFNFFRPDYMPTGEMTDLGLLAPELQLATDDTLPKTNNALGVLIFERYIGNPYIEFGPLDILVDLERDAPLASNPGELLDRYDILFMSGQMSSTMRQALLTRLNEMPNTNGGRDRVQEALYLIITSPEYMVQK